MRGGGNLATWKLLTSVTGETQIDLPESFEELHIEVRVASDSNVVFEFTIPYIALADNIKNYRNGYGYTSSNMMSVEVNVAKTTCTLASVTQGTGTSTTANAITTIWYK